MAALAVSLLLSLAIGEVAGILNAVMMTPGWAYNAGRKSTLMSGLTYVVGFGLIPAFAASTLPGHPAPRLSAVGAAAVLGLGGHFANVLPDLAGDEAAGVRGLTQRVAARSGSHRWIAWAGLGAAVLLATVGARSAGRVPFRAAIGIAAIDVALFAIGGVALV